MAVRGQTERERIFAAKALVKNDTITLNAQELKLDGKPYYDFNLRIKTNLVVGTGTGAKSDGEKSIIKSIFLKTDRGEEIIKPMPGRALYYLAETLNGRAPRADAIAAANGDYIVDIPIRFIDPRAGEASDTYLDSTRYDNWELQIGYGTESDLLTTVGTAVATGTAELTMFRSAEPLSGDAIRPGFHHEYGMFPPVDVGGIQQFKLEKILSLEYKRLWLITTSGAVAGARFTGTLDNAVIDRFTFESDRGFHRKDITFISEKDKNAEDYNLIAGPRTGIVVIDFVMDGSNKSAHKAGLYARNDLSWLNVGAPPANWQVNLAYMGIRPLLPKPGE